MKIVQVEYSKLVSEPGSFGNQKIGAVAQVESGEIPGAALASLRGWVNAQLNIDPKRQLTAEDKKQIALEFIQQELTGEIPF